MPDIPYKYLQDENGETFYPVTGSSSMVDPVPVSKGGTGADNANDARVNLGIRWVHVGRSTGGTAVPLPTDAYWTDIFVKTYFPLNASVCWLYNEPRIAIPQSYNLEGASPQNGASGTDRQACSIVISWDQGVYVREYYRDGTNYTSQTAFDVWVKY